MKRRMSFLFRKNIGHQILRLFAGIAVAFPSCVYGADIVSGTTPLLCGNAASYFYSPETSQGQQVSRQVSDDGRFVVFASPSSSMIGVPGPPLTYNNVYLKDTVVGNVIQLSGGTTSLGGFGGNNPCISPDGQCVAYSLYTGSSSSPTFNIGSQPTVIRNLGPNRMNSIDDTTQDVFVGGQPSLSTAGVKCAYTRFDGVVPNTTTPKLGVWCRHYNPIFVGEVRMDHLYSATGATGTASNYHSFCPVVSSNGDYVAYISGANNIILGDTNGSPVPYANLGDDIFRSPSVGGVNIRVSSDSTGGQLSSPSRWPSISVDGSYVAFQSDASSNSLIYRKQMVSNSPAGPLSVVTTNKFGGPVYNIHLQPSMSQNGRYVVFTSNFNFLTGGALTARNVFRRDMNSFTCECVSNVAGSTGAAPLNGSCDAPQISGDGLKVAYRAGAQNATSPPTSYYGQVVMTSQFFSTMAGPYGGGGFPTGP